MNKSGYLYFYDEKAEYSQLLHLTTLCASIVFKKLYLCVSEPYFKFFNSRCQLPDNVNVYCVNAEELHSTMLTRLDSLYESRIIRSNCPPVERHCINRWLFLKGRNFFNEESLFAIDWDTLVFPGLKSYETHLRGIDLAATNLMKLGWEGAPNEPIWSLCPNLLFLSKISLDCYIQYLNKYITYSEKGLSIVAGLFCDMQPWSSVISSSLVKKSNLRLLDFNDINTHLALVDHNVRIIADCGLQFKEMRYYFAKGTQTYLETPYLRAKHLVFTDDGRPYFVIRNKSHYYQPPYLQEAAAIHFSGVEGKQLLFQSFIEDISNYLKTHLSIAKVTMP